MNIAILRASNRQKMSEIFTNKETLLSEKRKGKSEKSDTLEDFYLGLN